MNENELPPGLKAILKKEFETMDVETLSWFEFEAGARWMFNYLEPDWRKTLGRIISSCGAPNASDACRNVIALAREKLDKQHHATDSDNE